MVVDESGAAEDFCAHAEWSEEVVEPPERAWEHEPGGVLGSAVGADAPEQGELAGEFGLRFELKAVAADGFAGVVVLAEAACGLRGEAGDDWIALDERDGRRGYGRVEKLGRERKAGEHGAESAETAGGGEARLPVGAGIAVEEFGEIAEAAEVAPLVPSALRSEIERQLGEREGEDGGSGEGNGLESGAEVGERRREGGGLGGDAPMQVDVGRELRVDEADFAYVAEESGNGGEVAVPCGPVAEALEDGHGAGEVGRVDEQVEIGELAEGGISIRELGDDGTLEYGNWDIGGMEFGGDAKQLSSDEESFDGEGAGGLEPVGLDGSGEIVPAGGLQAAIDERAEAVKSGETSEGAPVDAGVDEGLDARGVGVGAGASKEQVEFRRGSKPVLGTAFGDGSLAGVHGWPRCMDARS